MSLPTDAAQMARDGGITTPKLGNNAFTTGKLFQIGQGQFIGRDNTQTGTGNVNATQTYPDISLTSALSAPFDATTAWRGLSAYLNQVINTNTSSANYFFGFGSLPSTVGTGSQNVAGAVLAPNGKIYCIPNDLDLPSPIIDPETLTTSSYAALGIINSRAYAGGSLAPNGRIYFASLSETVFRYIDPSNNTVVAYATITALGTGTGRNDFVGAVRGPNGKIYMIPYAQSLCYVVDPTNNSIQSFGTFSGIPLNSGATEYGARSGTLAPNGKIYCGPGNRTVCHVIDPSNNTISSFGNFALGPYIALTHPNGKIYFIPQQHTVCHIVDPNNNTSTSFYNTMLGSSTRTTAEAIVAPNGKIYTAPGDHSLALVIDPSNNSVATIATFPAGTGGLFTGILNTPQGRLIYINSGIVASPQMFACITNNNQNWNLNVCLSPFFNGSY